MALRVDGKTDLCLPVCDFAHYHLNTDTFFLSGDISPLLGIPTGPNDCLPRGTQRVMFPATAWRALIESEVRSLPRNQGLARVVDNIRPRCLRGIRDTIMILPQSKEIWDSEPFKYPLDPIDASYMEELWKRRRLNTVPRDMIRFWTVEEMREFEETFSRRRARRLGGQGSAEEQENGNNVFDRLPADHMLFFFYVGLLEARPWRQFSIALCSRPRLADV